MSVYIPKVSIIIPVYNVADYIQLCLESVLNQTYKNIEILIIDDCGDDNSIVIAKDILNDYSGKDVRIITHNRNRGLSAARNTGINAASGDYVYFLDSDDSISYDCIQVLVNAIYADPNIEMVIGNYKCVGNKKKFKEISLQEGLHTKDFFIHYQEYITAWNKLISLKFLKRNNLYFIEGLIHEDEVWTFCLLSSLKKMFFVNNHTYNYLIRNNSLSNIDDYWLHFRNYADGHIYIINYLAQHGCSSNQLIYKIIFEKIYRDFFEPLWYNHPNESFEFYKKLRHSSYWSLFDLLKFKITVYEFFVPFTFLFPRSIGYKICRRLMMKLDGSSLKV